jgi:hypothetical protein
MPGAIKLSCYTTKAGARNCRPLRNELRDLSSPPRQAETGEGLPDTTRNAGSGTGSGAAGGPLAANSETIEPNFTADYTSEPHPLPVCVQVGIESSVGFELGGLLGRIEDQFSALSYKVCHPPSVARAVIRASPGSPGAFHMSLPSSR